MRPISFRPFKTEHNTWTVRFTYRGIGYCQSFGKGRQAEINAQTVRDAIVFDIKNDRFLGSIAPYLQLIPAHLRGWRKSPKPPNPSREMLAAQKKNGCIGCGSTIRVRNGTVNGRQRWLCRDCGRSQLEEAKYSFPSGPECYECGKTTRKRGKFRGVQRYWCKDCGSYWSDQNLPIVPKKINWITGRD